MTVIEYLRASTQPVSVREIVTALGYSTLTVESILEDLKKDGHASQLNSGRWEATAPMPRGPRDNRGQGRRKHPRPSRRKE